MTDSALGAPRMGRRTVLGLVVAVAVALSVASIGASPATAQSCSSDPDIQVDQSACSSTLAVSATGSASGTDCTGESDGISGAGVSCISVSGTGDASNTSSRDSCGSANDLLVSGPEPVFGASAGCIAVSGTGDASNEAGHSSCGGSGNVFSASIGCVAASGTGTASNRAGETSCGWSGAASVGVGCVAISGTGNASNSANAGAANSNLGACGSGFFTAIDVGCLAVSGTGDASNSSGNYSCGRASTNNRVTAVGCVAASGAGDAANSAGHTSCGDAIGLALAIGCVEVDGQDPARAIVGGGYGCVVTAGYSCSFVGKGTIVGNGVVAATTGSWAITHQVGSTTVTDVSGNGPNAFPFMFDGGIVYTLTVDSDGSGLVAAGTPRPV